MAEWIEPARLTPDVISTPLLPADLVIAGTAHVGVQRARRRSRCAFCRVRRQLYRIVLTAYGADPALTEARCASCWGIRE